VQTGLGGGAGSTGHALLSLLVIVLCNRAFRYRLACTGCR
jgi:hypothetical protein